MRARRGRGICPGGLRLDRAAHRSVDEEMIFSHCAEGISRLPLKGKSFPETGVAIPEHACQRLLHFLAGWQ
jgi:hypothetical protein